MMEKQSHIHDNGDPMWFKINMFINLRVHARIDSVCFKNLKNKRSVLKSSVVPSIWSALEFVNIY